MFKKIIISIVFFFIFLNITTAQVGKDSGFWEFIENSEARKSIVTIGADFPGGLGTGVVVVFEGKKYVITAAHMVYHMDSEGKITERALTGIKVAFHGGQIFNVTPLTCSITDDLAVLDCEIPDTINGIPLAAEPIKNNDNLQFICLGGISPTSAPIRHFRGRGLFPSTPRKFIASPPLIPGDSGGACINDAGELVGICSGGWQWLENKVSDGTTEYKLTWPAQGAGVESIRELLQRLN